MNQMIGKAAHLATCAVLFLAFALFAPGLGVPQAKALSLIPISQDFKPSGKESTQTFRLENETNEPVAVVVKITTREVSIDGEETNAETKDFTVFPSQVLLNPRQSQMVRVQWRGPSAPRKELAYRIIAEQLPVKRHLEPNTHAIQIVMRYVGSIYVVPSGVRPDIVISSARGVTDARNRRMLELVFRNNGRSHGLLDELELTVAAGGSSQTLKGDQLKDMLGENILAESERQFLLPWPQGLPFTQPTVEFKYTPLR